MKRAIYPGTFDPITFGHIDIIRRSLKLFDEIVVAVAKRREKKTLFTHQERIELTRQTLKKTKKVRVLGFDSLLVDFADEIKACVIIRGLRAISDFDYELQMALINRKLDRPVETIFLTSSEQFIFVSSTLVKEIARLGGDVTPFVPGVVARALSCKIKGLK
ncbi:MAG: pantetheine-phosphate adenylyltransferase [candidate division WOR-3 bacterium]